MTLLRLAVLATALGAFPAAAQEWPSGTVRVIVPYAAGGPVDVPARLVIDRLTAQTKGTFILENRAGAGGSIGLQSVVQSPPDGSTFLFTTSSVTIVPEIYPKLGFDPLRDLTLISLVTEIAITVAVRGNSPIRDLRRPDRARQGQSRQVDVRVGRRRHRQSYGGRIAEKDGRHRHAACAVPRHCAGSDVALRRRHRFAVRQHDRSCAARARRSHPCAGGWHAAARAGTAGFTADRGRCPGLHRNQLVWIVRAARVAAGYRRPPRNRTAEGARRSDRQGKERGPRDANAADDRPRFCARGSR